jgi:SPOR domain
MDQNSTNGTDKRSWRERLGIGAGASGKDMPRISDEFSSASPAAKAAVRPAPMAPRANVKAAPPRAAAISPASEKLADKLKAQRDAQERLAEQRVQAAKSRAEIKPGENPTNGSSNGNKPKFAFAVEEPPAAEIPKPVAPPPSPRGTTPVPPQPQQVRPNIAPQPQVTRPVMPPPVSPPPVLNTQPLTPPRQPLGAERPSVPPRPAMPPPVTPTRPQQRFAPPPAPPGYVPSSGSYPPQAPAYRPIDPGSRGYAAGGYSPPPSYTPPIGGYNNQPRLSVPPARGYGAEPVDPRARHLRPPARPSVGYRDDFNEGDIFDDPRGQRRATAGDYSQAYRDAEHGYDEDLPPSRGPWLPLMLLLLLAIVAGGAVWWLYNNSAGNSTAGSGANAPVVEGPAQPAKVVPEPAAEQPANTPSKKLIYDRIVGDREVLSGDVIESEEVPAQPGDSTNLQDGDPAQGLSDPAQPTGQEDLVPLPLPPPPGEDGAGDQQGAAPPLDPSGKTSSQAMSSPAASESQAAVPSQGTATGVEQKSDAIIAKSDASAAPPATGTVAADPLPVPGETPSSTQNATQDTAQGTAPGATGSETIQDAAPQAEEPEPAPAKKVVAASSPKKPAQKKPANKSLGSEPVVLVPPADGTEPVLEQDVASAGDAVASGGGLYGGEALQDGGVSSVAATPAPAPVKKKRTLADLFRNSEADEAQQTQVASIDPQPTPTPPPAPAKTVTAAPVQQVATAGGYVVQLASFPNQGDASKEYGRLKAKHASVLSGLAPVITQAVVGGSTRYRLAAGTMATREQASAVCAKLFAAGERDCLVRRQ